MTQNEIITIVLSAGALLVSLLTLYFTYFHKRAGLVGVLVGRKHRISPKYIYEIEYALSNTGNVQLILKEVKVLIGHSASEMKLGAHSVSDSECSDSPAVIEPGNVKLVHLRFMEDAIAKAKKNTGRCFVSFTLISSRGIIYELMHDLTSLNDYDIETELIAWEPFKLKNSDA